jgi:ubiquinone/menaquinone biosynthesis C-methylase UbiE
MKDSNNKNIDEQVVADFGREWKHFNHKHLDDSVLNQSFRDYFNIFPIDKLSDSEGFDMGCGSGRWAKYVAPKVKFLHCIDASNEALDQAKSNLNNYNNCDFECSSVDFSMLPDNSQDFGYSLGVLHHIPDTKAALRSCSLKLKSGAPFLLYLYYRFDNKPKWFVLIWKISDFFRRMISKLPYPLKLLISQLIAFLVYFPLARLARLFEILNKDVANFPLSEYRSKSFYMMRTDSLDRFGTRLEQRFTKNEILEMLEDTGFENITFSNKAPYWVSLAYKK